MTLLQAYLQSPKARRTLSKRPGDKGFSLIELVVVVAILAILAAVALPNFLGVSKDGQIAAAENTLATAVKECAVKEARTNNSTMGVGGATPGAGPTAPVQALNASLNGYNLVAGYDKDGNAADITKVNKDTAAIDLSKEADQKLSCYGVYAVANNDLLPTFGITFNQTTGVTTKECFVPNSDQAYREGCLKADKGVKVVPEAAAEKNSKGVW